MVSPLDTIEGDDSEDFDEDKHTHDGMFDVSLQDNDMRDSYAPLPPEFTGAKNLVMPEYLGKRASGIFFYFIFFLHFFFSLYHT